MSYYRYERFRPHVPHDTPGTNFLIATNIATFILYFLRLLPQSLYFLLVSGTLDVWHSPWTLFTYPLVSTSGGASKFLSFLMALVWLYAVGGMFERRWGTKSFLLTFFVFSGISAFFLSVGGLLIGVNRDFGELLCPLVDLTVIWAILEPDTPVLFFAFPMRLRWLALICCGILLFEFGTPYPLLGFFSLGGCAAAYIYSRYFYGHSFSAPFQKSTRLPKRGFSLSPFEWYRRWQFKRRFRKLWGN